MGIRCTYQAPQLAGGEGGVVRPQGRSPFRLRRGKEWEAEQRASAPAELLHFQLPEERNQQVGLRQGPLSINASKPEPKQTTQVLALSPSGRQGGGTWQIKRL